MLKFALKSMRIRMVRCLLVTLSIVVSAGVALLAYNVSGQVSEGIVSAAAYYDIILGPSGSSTQLAMNTMFFTDRPLGTIPYTYVTELENSGLTNDVVPFTMGDSYNSARIIGTTPDFLDGQTLNKGGTMFAQPYEAVVGSAVAADYRVSVGDELITSHGLTGTGAEHAASPLIVTGILSPTGTNRDNVIFTSYKTVWDIHSGEHGDEGEDEDETEAEEGSVCAILVRSKGFNEYNRLTQYYARDAHLLCINPATVLREILNNVDTGTKVVYLLCGVILVMNILVITVITMLNMFDSRKDIALMRLIGISMRRIAMLYTLENGILGIVSSFLAMLLAHVGLSLMGRLAASMGIVLSAGRIYPLEWAIIALVFVIGILPTIVCTLKMASKDGLDG